jgi:hypothetical protein
MGVREHGRPEVPFYGFAFCYVLVGYTYAAPVSSGVGLFRLALRDYGVPMLGVPSVPFLVNLDTLL